MAAVHKSAVVTGAGSGIGRAVALALMKDGYAVALAGRRKDALEKTAEMAGDMGAQHACRATDVGNAAQVKALFAARQAKPSAGSTSSSTMPASAPRPCRSRICPSSEWKSVVDANLTGAFLCTQEAIKIMKARQPRGGRIINNGSISAHAPRPVLGGLHRDQARHYRPHQVDFARRPRIRHRLRPDRHRQRSHRDDGAHDARACRSPTASRSRAAHGRASTSRARLLYMASLPLDANVQFMTIMATKMPFVGRG